MLILVLSIYFQQLFILNASIMCTPLTVSLSLHLVKVCWSLTFVSIMWPCLLTFVTYTWLNIHFLNILVSS